MLNFVLSGTTCKTVGGADPGKPCVFPFTFEGVTYTECTTAGNAPGDLSLWCSTLTYVNGTHVGGQGKWGNCNTTCQGNAPTTSTTTATTVTTTTTTRPKSKLFS